MSSEQVSTSQAAIFEFTMSVRDAPRNKEKKASASV